MLTALVALLAGGALLIVARHVRSSQADFRAFVRARYPNRAYELRKYQWYYHDLLLGWFLRAATGPEKTFVFTGDSTVAQANLPASETIAGRLDLVSALTSAAGGRLKFLNIGTNGTAEAYLDTSIGHALRSGAAHVFVGVTIRDYTHVDEKLRSRPKAILAFRRYYRRLNDFSSAGHLPVTSLALRRLRLRIDHVIRGTKILSEPRYLAPPDGPVPDEAFEPLRVHEPWAALSGRSAFAPISAEPGVATFRLRHEVSHGASTGSVAVEPTIDAGEGSSFYVSDAELRTRTMLKNENKELLLESNPFLTRLEIVMRRYAAATSRLTFVLMPMNRDIDVRRFGLDPAIPRGLAERMVDMATRCGQRVCDLGAIWDGSYFAPNDVVHLNRQGSMRAAALLVSQVDVLRDHLPQFRSVPFHRLVAAYRETVDPATFARTMQLVPEDESFRIVALGEQQPFLGLPLDLVFVLTARLTGIGGSPPRLQVLGDARPTALLEFALQNGELSVRNSERELEIRNGDAIAIVVPGQAELRIGYLDRLMIDREFNVRILDLIAFGDRRANSDL